MSTGKRAMSGRFLRCYDRPKGEWLRVSDASHLHRAASAAGLRRVERAKVNSAFETLHSLACARSSADSLRAHLHSSSTSCTRYADWPSWFHLASSPPPHLASTALSHPPHPHLALATPANRSLVPLDTVHKASELERAFRCPYTIPSPSPPPLHCPLAPPRDRRNDAARRASSVLRDVAAKRRGGLKALVLPAALVSEEDRMR